VPASKSFSRTTLKASKGEKHFNLIDEPIIKIIYEPMACVVRCAGRGGELDTEGHILKQTNIEHILKKHENRESECE
jgi:hypothetical protein